MNSEILRENLNGYIPNELIDEIINDKKKAKLFDSLQIENQTILDTISQVKIANQMYEQQNKQLHEDYHKLYFENMERGQKLEKIEKAWNNREFSSEGEDFDKILKEILKEK